MDAVSLHDLRSSLEALEERLREAADWIDEQNAQPDELPCRVISAKRLAPLLVTFRDALNAGAFANDVVMQDERARAFPEDIKERGEAPMPRFIGYWVNYVSSGGPVAMFLERLMRGWLPGYDFGKPSSIEEVVDWPSFPQMTVRLYVVGLRYLALAVHKETERQCPPHSDKVIETATQHDAASNDDPRTAVSGYLGLSVKKDRQEVNREGFAPPVPVQVSGPVAWPMFLALFKAADAGLSKQELARLPGDKSATARRKVKQSLKDKLKRPLSIAIPDNEWKLTEA